MIAKAESSKLIGYVRCIRRCVCFIRSNNGVFEIDMLMRREQMDWLSFAPVYLAYFVIMETSSVTVTSRYDHSGTVQNGVVVKFLRALRS